MDSNPASRPTLATFWDRLKEDDGDMSVGTICGWIAAGGILGGAIAALPWAEAATQIAEVMGNAIDAAGGGG